MFHRCVCWILSVSMFYFTVLPVRSFAGEQIQPQTDLTDRQATQPAIPYDQAMQRLDQFMALVQELRTHIDRSQFDPEALISRLDYDAESIIGFIGNDIYFEQYPGLLRGVRGTLMSRAGNALDQSVLLASLLKDAGFDARIARGKLDDAQAISLLQQMAKPRKNAPASGDPINYRIILERLARLAGIPDDQVETFVESSLTNPDLETSRPFKDAQADKASILQQLSGADISPEPKEITDELTQEARDYFWVEYKAGPSSPWIPVHPALGGIADQFAGIKQLEVYADQVPEELLHRFRFQVFIEQKTGDKLVTTALTSPWQRPVANLLGLSLSFSNIPDGLTGLADMEQPGRIADKTNFLIPVFSVAQNQQPQSDFFDMNGIVFDKEAVSMGGAAAGLFQTIGDKMEGALQKTVQMESDESTADGEFRALSAQWIEYTLIAPGGGEKKIKRFVIDRIGAANREAGIVRLTNYVDEAAAIWKLAASNSFILSPGRYPEAYILDRYLERLISARLILEMILHDSYFPDNLTKITPELFESTRDTKELWLADSIERGVRTEPGKTDYRHEPGLIIVSNGLFYNEQGSTERLVVDIANNSRRILQLEDDKVFYAPLQAILSGTWATRAEQINLLGPAVEYVTQWNTREAFKQARDDQVPLQVIKPGSNSDQWLVGGISVEARHAIARDLEQGFAVIIPERVSGDGTRVGWWRVNPESGETLGMINEGLGSEALKYKIVLTLVAIKVTLLMAVPGLMNCLNGNQCSDAGCWRGAAVGVLIGYAIGFAVGLIAGTLVVPGAAAGVAVSVEAAAAVSIVANTGIARGRDMANAMEYLPTIPSCMENN